MMDTTTPKPCTPHPLAVTKAGTNEADGWPILYVNGGADPETGENVDLCIYVDGVPASMMEMGDARADVELMVAARNAALEACPANPLAAAAALPSILDAAARVCALNVDRGIATGLVPGSDEDFQNAVMDLFDAVQTATGNADWFNETLASLNEAAAGEAPR